MVTHRLRAVGAALILTSALVILPSIVSAQTKPDTYDPDSLNLVPCGHASATECNFAYFMVMVDNIVNAIFFLLTLLLLFLLLKAGWQYMSGRGNPQLLMKAKGAFIHIAVGLLLMLGGWVAINYAIEALTRKDVVDNPLKSGTLGGTGG